MLRPIRWKLLPRSARGDAYVAAILHKLALEQELLMQNALSEDGKRPWIMSPESKIDVGKIDWSTYAGFANAAGALATRTVSASEGLPNLLEIENLLKGA